MPAKNPSMTRSRKRWLLWPLLGVVAACIAQTPDSAISQLHLLRQQLHDSRARNDWQANLRYAKAYRELLNGAPNSQLEVARAELQLGETDAGLRDLAVFAAMGQTIDPALVFPTIGSLPEQQAVRDLRHTLEANRSEISRASTAFVLTDPALLTEDIDYDSRRQQFLISSVRLGKVVAADPHGRERAQRLLGSHDLREFFRQVHAGHLRPFPRTASTVRQTCLRLSAYNTDDEFDPARRRDERLRAAQSQRRQRYDEPRRHPRRGLEEGRVRRLTPRDSPASGWNSFAKTSSRPEQSGRLFCVGEYRVGAGVPTGAVRVSPMRTSATTSCALSPLRSTLAWI